MADKEPEVASALRGFYAAYWARIRMNLWGEVNEGVVKVLLGRFRHQVVVCPDGILVIMRRASSDSFTWDEAPRSVKEVMEEVLGAMDVWTELHLSSMRPGMTASPDFDLDLAPRRVEDAELPFDRVQVRYVPFARDHGFWTTDNAQRLAGRNLSPPAS
jgi:hypothetical protein